MRSTLFIVTIALLIGCGQSEKDGDISLEEIVGTYSGMVPCPDCEGIDYAVTLNEDMSYSDQLKYVGKSAKTLTATGQFDIEAGIITLNQPTEGYNKFRKHPEGLLMLDKNGGEITGSTASMYILRRIEENQGADEDSDLSDGVAAALPDTMIKPKQDLTEVDEVSRAKVNRHINMWSEGVNFHAMGTEPDWSLNIKFSEGMQFTTMSGYDIQTPMGDPSEKEDGKFRTYTAHTESGDLIVELKSGECHDQMLGEKYEYEVTVMTKNSSDREYQTYKGCGEYVVDPRLHNIWVVEEFEGNAIDHSSFKRGIPQIEISVVDDIYMGHDGCNSIRGEVVVEGNVIKFEPGPTTLMACDDDGLSSKISLALTELHYEYVVGRRLELKNEGKVRFVLKNVD